MKLHEVIDTIDVLDDLWITRVLALHDMRSPSPVVEKNDAALFLSGAASDLGEPFPRDLGNPEVAAMFKFYQQQLTNNKQCIRDLFKTEGYSADMEVAIANPPGSNWAGYNLKQES